MSFRRPILVLLASALPIAAQDAPTLKGRSFHPPDHTMAAFIDVEAVLETELWDVLERSPAKLLLEEFRKTFGFHIDELQRFDAAMTFHPEAEVHGKRQSAVIVLHGGDSVGLQEFDIARAGGRYQWVDVGRHKVLTGSDPSMVAVRPGLLVLGDTHHLLGILEGSIKGGVPAPELMPLVAGGKALAYFAMLLDNAELKLMWPDDWFDRDDPARYVAARLVQREADGHLVLTARVGFEMGETGPALLSGKIDEGIAHAKESFELRFLQPVFDRMVKRVEGRELIVELEVDGGEAIGPIVQGLYLRVIAPARRAAEAAVVEAEVRAVRLQEMVKAIEKEEAEARKKKEVEKKKSGKEDGS